MKKNNHKTITSFSSQSQVVGGRGRYRHFLIGGIWIILGILGAFVFMELALFVAGNIFVSKNKISHTRERVEEGVVRIVALGESTTAQLNGPAWPEYLELELNRRVGKRLYRVYNYGVAGSNSSAILARLRTQVLDLHPHIVITMMGINDTKYLSLPVQKLSVLDRIVMAGASSRTVKLFTILWRITRSGDDRIYIQRAMQCGKDPTGDILWEHEYLPRYEAIISSLYFDRFSGQFLDSAADKKAADVLLEYLRLYPFSYRALEVIVDHYATRSDWSRVLSWSGRAMHLDPYIRLCISRDPALDFETKQRMMLGLGDIMDLMKSLHASAQIILERRLGLGEEFYHQIRESLELPINASNIDTETSYNELASLLASREIHHVAVQYPLQPVQQLKEQLVGQKNTVFVSNEQNFQTALKDRPYSDLFVDNFAGIFGHTTSIGSQIIAQTVADEIVKIVP